MSVNRQVIEAASWRLVCELFRRYPDRFVLIQTHPGGGVYDCLALLNRDHKEVAGFNRDGSMRVCDPPGEVDPTKTYSDIWRQVVEADDLKTVVDRIAATLRLPRVHHLPKGTPEVIVYRLIADFLAHTVFGRVEWRCLNGFEDTSGVGGGVRTKWFDRFPLAKDGLRERRKDDVLGEPAYRFWFICRDDDPVLCINKAGKAWTLDGKEVDMPTLYAQHKRIWPLVWQLTGQYLP